MINMSILIACAVFQNPAPTIQWGGANSGVNQIRIQLVTDAKMLKEIWQLTHGDSTDGLPQVNFDRCRLVLAYRGRETGVQRVAATGVDHSGLEIVLTIDASYSRESRAQATQETTAWGLFMIPLTPERVRVRRNASEDPSGEPQWETVAVLEPDDRRSREREASRGPEPGSSPEMLRAYKEHLEANRRPFTMKLQRPPSYFVSHDYDERWVRAIRSGIDVTRDYLGNYGPVQVYIVGQENEELSDPAHRNEIAEAFCNTHNAGSDRPVEDCLADEGNEMARKAVEGALRSVHDGGLRFGPAGRGVGVHQCAHHGWRGDDAGSGYPRVRPCVPEVVRVHADLDDGRGGGAAGRSSGCKARMGRVRAGHGVVCTASGGGGRS